MGDSASADLDPEEFRDLGYRAVDMIADYYRDLDDRAVYPGVPAGEVAAAFEEELPESGSDPGSVIDEWAEKVVPYATHNTSPRFFGFVMGGGTQVGTLAEALAAAVNMNVGGWKPAPSGTEIERRTVRWLAEMVSYPTDCGGLLTSGGTMANVTAILAALRNTADYDTTVDGLQSDDRSGRYTLYMPDHEGHSSIVRTATCSTWGGTRCDSYPAARTSRWTRTPSPGWSRRTRPAATFPSAWSHRSARSTSELWTPSKRSPTSARSGTCGSTPTGPAARSGPSCPRSATCIAGWNAPTRSLSTPTSGSLSPTSVAACS
jgi:hypothetical protein